jgi:hypothetical protein
MQCYNNLFKIVHDIYTLFDPDKESETFIIKKICESLFYSEDTPNTSQCIDRPFGRRTSKKRDHPFEMVPFSKGLYLLIVDPRQGFCNFKNTIFARPSDKPVSVRVVITPCDHILKLR